MRALLLAERRAYRAAICAGNEGALKRIRDTSANSVAQLGAVRVLEQLDDAEEERNRSPGQRQPGLTIVVVNRPTAQPQPMTIDVVPAPEPPGDPIFRHPHER